MENAVLSWLAMQLTPSQLAMSMLLGEWIPRIADEQPLVEKIRDGRAFLVELTKVDFGFDPIAWHKYLCETNTSGYLLGNKHDAFPEQIKTALASTDWQSAVASILEKAAV